MKANASSKPVKDASHLYEVERRDRHAERRFPHQRAATVADADRALALPHQHQRTSMCWKAGCGSSCRTPAGGEAGGVGESFVASAGRPHLVTNARRQLAHFPHSSRRGRCTTSAARLELRWGARHSSGAIFRLASQDARLESRAPSHDLPIFQRDELTDRRPQPCRRTARAARASALFAGGVARTNRRTPRLRDLELGQPARQCRITSPPPVPGPPCARDGHATSPQRSSGTPMMAASATSGIWNRRSRPRRDKRSRRPNVHVLPAVDDIDDAFIVLARGVAGVQPAIGEGLRRGLGLVQ